MERSLKLLSNRKRDIINILKDIETDKPEIIKDVYELTDQLYNFLASKDVEWINKFYNMIKIFVELNYESDDDVKKIISNCKNINKDFVEYFFDGLNLNNTINNKNKLDEADETDSDDEADEIEIENNNNMENIKKFKWRDGQLEAIKKIIANNFLSGLVSMITGSGKSLIFLKTIDQHFTRLKPTEGSLYILTCPRIDIIRSLFFKYVKGEYVLNTEKIKFWKDNDIINLDNFNIIDCVNKVAKTVTFNPNKYNLLLINNDSLKVLYKNTKNQKYINANTNLVIIDECQCLSAIKFYEIIRQMKYNYKIPIMGFSATAIRDNKQSEQKVVDILSKSTGSTDSDDSDDDSTNSTNSADDNSEKKINLIYSYDLLQGIKDEIVLPYRTECISIKAMKGNKIGLTNKSILNDILAKLIDVKAQKLPYKKFVVWTNKKEIMKECYLYIEKTFPQLKVYCTSSFDNELSNQGFNTNYEEYYNSKGNSILICINKCKEGSDIPYVDCGIYFDGVKNRSILVHIQTSGRVIRPDVEKRKTHGDLIDMFILKEGENPTHIDSTKNIALFNKIIKFVRR